ncbi:hypothetical protein ACS78V_07745 [Yersinia enterocolitica]|uniref:hypothetical protein n=1 Tax=Yersinia enterocolitica TaxID=630 RepID=UPI0003D7CB53|nr:hypothetical protein [Yersinia enterocolitica]CCQ39925.1 hypothetical protein YE5303_12191 [Yersinia enterocolitica (type O:5) str. YE53/03]
MSNSPKYLHAPEITDEVIAEAFRVLRAGGVLIFKWNEVHIPTRDIIKLSPVPPIFGHPSGKRANTNWVCFQKPGENLIAQLESAQKELSAANERLSKPVVLPKGYSVRAGHPINEGERHVLIPKEGGRWLSRFDVEHAIRVAGFTVEGE